MKLIQCDAPGCVRGIVHLPGGWGDKCTVCGGEGSFTRAALARLLDENESTLDRLLKGKKMRPRTLRRFVDKIMAFWPDEFKKQRELFS